MKSNVDQQAFQNATFRDFKYKPAEFVVAFFNSLQFKIIFLTLSRRSVVPHFTDVKKKYVGVDFIMIVMYI